MTTLQRQQPLSGDSSSTNGVHPSFIATKTISNVLANVKPTPSNRQMVDLPISATIEEAFDVLLAEDILSVPVYRLNEEDQTKVYVTIISVLDLLKLLSQHVSTRKKSPWEKNWAGNETQHNVAFTDTMPDLGLLEQFFPVPDQGSHRTNRRKLKVGDGAILGSFRRGPLSV